MSVYWPLLEPALADANLPRAAQPTGEGQAILIVDDEPELVRLAEEIVASLGYEAIGFSDAIGRDRIVPSRARSDSTRCSPTSACRSCRARRSQDDSRRCAADIPILLVTGHREKQTDARALRAGIIEILDKPLRAGDLREALGRAFATMH